MNPAPTIVDMIVTWLPGIVVMLAGLGAGVLYSLVTSQRTEPAPSQASTRSRVPLVVGVLGGAAVIVLAFVIYALGGPSTTPQGQQTQQQQTVQQMPDDPQLRALLARLEQNPGDIDNWVAAGSHLVRQMRLPEAQQYIERALQLDPEHPGALTQYAALLVARGESPKALEQLDQVLKRNPETIEAWALRGMIAIKSGNDALAKESFGEYIKRAPDGPEKEKITAMLGHPVVPKTNNGQALWSNKCASCHGPTGKGDGPMGQKMNLPDMTSRDWQNGVTDVTRRKAIEQGVVRETEQGTKRMPAFADLDDAELSALLEQMRSFQSSPRTQR